jgi:hypothetical protein
MKRAAFLLAVLLVALAWLVVPAEGEGKAHSHFTCPNPPHFLCWDSGVIP